MSDMIEPNVSGLSVKADVLPHYNYLLYQNKIPLCHDCRVGIAKGCTYRSVELIVEGEHIEPYSTRLSLPESGELSLNTIGICMQEELLLSLEQEVYISISFRLEAEGQTICSELYSVRIQPYNYWHGSRVMPELLSSFALSNQPILSRIGIKAAQYLDEWTGNSSLDEYQQGSPNRVRQQVAAVYEALRQEGLVYASIPPSFTSQGQRIRLADEVLSSKLGNCLDLSLLFAACLEYIGLHPLLVLVKGHAFVGCWLVEEIYPYPTGDDVSFLLKASADGINEMVLLEATAVASTTVVPFEEAVRMAELSLHRDDYLECFIDIYRARLGKVYPLRSRSLIGDKWVVENSGIEHEEYEHKIHRLSKYELEFADTSEISKQAVWERKLLDISLRNNLLNIRIGRNVLPLISFNINEWEDHLQSEGAFQIFGNPSSQEPQLSKGAIYASEQYEQELGQLILEELQSRRLHAFVPDDEVDVALKYLHRSARTAQEENGANSLFLTLGVLRWYESERSTQARYAPILLLPVEIVRQRPSIGGRYSIRSRGEDVVLNITLLEMLKQKFGVSIQAQDLLIKDDKGVDVLAILSAMKLLVKELKGWDVLTEAMLGLFSFSKFVMWNDIHSHAHLLRESKVIRALMDGEKMEELSLEEIGTRASDRDIQPKDLLLPIDVDSSQLRAILDAGRGRSFVLHGPPGTGKSQTITNMIAYALSLGKRVLFVAEKMAALSVVQSRLERIGLGAFCLELHSNKSTKTHILEQLARPLDFVIPQHRAEDFERSSQALYSSRLHLISYLEALHGKRISGYTLYEHINHYQALSARGISPVEVRYYAELDEAKLAAINEELKDLELLYSISGPWSGHALACLDTSGKLPIIPSELQQMLEGLLPKLRKADEARMALSAFLGQRLDDSHRTLELCHSLGQAILAEGGHAWQGQDLRIHQQAEIETLWEAATSLAKQEEETIAEIEQWEHKYVKADKSLDRELVCEAWAEAEKAWFLPRYFKRRALMRSLRSKLANPLLSLEQVAVFVALERKRSEQAERTIAGTDAVLKAFCGADQRPSPVVRARYAYSKGIYHELCKLDEPLREGCIAAIASCTPERLLSLRGLCLEHQVALLDYLEHRAHLDAYATIHAPEGGYAETLLRQLPVALGEWHKLRDWALWCQKRRDLRVKGLEIFVDMLEASQQKPSELYQSMTMGIHKAWSERFIAEDPALSSFNGLLFEEAIARFRASVRDFQGRSQTELQKRLVARLEACLSEGHSAELTFLKRNIQNRGRGKAVRDIFLSVPHLLPYLAPCMLMSPISVAQYLSLEGDKFDLVIFDEASQMPTSEAIGAIARGHNLIVVGDPKQMPPTSFFSSTQTEEELSELDDMESILDDCITLTMPEYYLTWHYRSKHESLIAFSNAQYYQDKLYTFPSPDDLCSRVRLVPVPGVYDKGSSRSNRIEAQAIVDEILRRLADEVLREQSIGVVAFNQSQQHLIEDLLFSALSKRRELEGYALQGDEPIFIKNLENVQGDERDVILFSVGYGPDKEGRVSMNFGPLNQQGGERRLNVAVTRARYEMVVFSALKSEDVDLKRTKAKGVEGLKLFLEFAERGVLSRHAEAVVTQTSEMLSALAEALRQRGYRVDTDLGRSGFKVNLAVLDPREEGRYLLGILCDGAGYYQTPTTQDRELVQPAVLGALGWELMRLWSVDWFVDPERVLNRILDRLRALERGKSVPSM